MYLLMYKAFALGLDNYAQALLDVFITSRIIHFAHTNTYIHTYTSLYTEVCSVMFNAIHIFITL